MKLTRVERWILSNQYRILEALDTDEADSYAEVRQALEEGYEAEYEDFAQHISEHEMSEEECREVTDILSMFSTLHYAYEDLEDKSGIEEWRVRFAGFDGNNETRQMAYARYFCESGGGRYTELDRGDGFNSHCPVIDRYRSMLEEWRKSPNPNKLTKVDIVRIVSP